MGSNHITPASQLSRNQLLRLSWLIKGLLLPVVLFAQQGFYVPKQGKIHFSGDSSTIFSNVINQGKLGVGKGAVVTFSGTVWENHPSAQLTDESDSTTGTGGWVRFVNNHTAQRLIAGYNAAVRTGPMFANLQIANRHGVHLQQSSAKVRHQVALAQGLVYLNNNTFVVGHQAPGNITGFNPNRFFVTGDNPGSSLLLRENVAAADGRVVFPIGKREGSYTPAAIQNKSTGGDDFYVTAFHAVSANLFSGSDLTSQGVNTTWQAGRAGRSDGEAELFLQHEIKDEGTLFSLNRTKTYISQYLATGWDTGKPQLTPAAGALTTGAALPTAGLNSRTFGASFGKTAYFTKFTVPDSLLTKIIWGAYRLSKSTVAVHWQTKPEINVKYFVVQRRLSNESIFRNVGAADSKAPNGISLNYLNYSLNDPNTYRGISYYRLQVFDYQGGSYYTNIVAVNGELGNPIVVWPNPSQGPFSVLVNSPLATQVVVFNAIGQKLYEKAITVQNQSVVEIKDLRLIPGTYVVAIYDKEGNVLDATKLLIIR